MHIALDVESLRPTVVCSVYSEDGRNGLETLDCLELGTGIVEFLKNGQCVFYNVPPGKHALVVPIHKRRDWRLIEPLHITVPDRIDSPLTVAVLVERQELRRWYEVSGRILGVKEGTVKVRFRSSSGMMIRATVSEDAMFRARLPHGRWSLEAEAPHFLPVTKTIDLQGPLNDLRLSLVPYARVTGTVYAPLRSSLRDCTITLISAVPTARYDFITTPEGEFSGEVAPGNYSIRVGVGDTGFYVKQQTLVGDTTLDVRLPATCRVRGRVQCDLPIPEGAFVLLASPEQPSLPLSSAVLDRDGGFLIQASRGPYIVIVAVEGVAYETGIATVEEDPELIEVKLRIRAEKVVELYRGLD